MAETSPPPAVPATGPATGTAAPQATARAKPRAVAWTNPITLLGLLLVGAGLVLLLTFWLFVLLFPSAEDNQYLNIIGFMMLPGVLMTGLALCPVGIFLRRWRVKRFGPSWQISVRGALVFLAVTFFLILPVLGVCGYKGYEYTDSAEFCGTVCHNMDPQYVRYKQSPHARVTCAGCHIGPGAAPFVKAKLSGLRQVYKTALDTYPRPVPPAIVELRPARETCEQCHWPSQFFGSKLKKIPHYAPDEQNTLNTYEILVKVGGLNNHLGQAEGIHMHMLDRVEYVSDDERRLERIPWVRYKYPDGTTKVFRSDGKSGDDPQPEGHLRRLDCIDCHNLAGHEFVSPERAVNHALSVSRLDVSLPFIKREAVRVLCQPYKTKPEALDAIGKSLTSFYRTAYPAVWGKRPDAVNHAVEAVREIYRSQMHPEMKVDWRTYPRHIGHLESPGCFRCHDGLHVADDGRRITSDCNACHSFLYRKPASDPALAPLAAVTGFTPGSAPGTEREPSVIIEQKFNHPMRIHEGWGGGLGPHERMLCSDCHDGGLGAMGWRDSQAKYTCGDCHPSGRWLSMRSGFRPAGAPWGVPWREPAATRPTTAPAGPVPSAVPEGVEVPAAALPQ